jgi:hypothetical protein
MSAAGSAAEAGRNAARSIRDPVSGPAGAAVSAAGASTLSVGSGSLAAGEAGAEDGRVKMDADEARGDPMLSAGRAGAASVVVVVVTADSAPAGSAFALSSALGPPLAEASWPGGAGMAGTGVAGVRAGGVAFTSAGWVSWSWSAMRSSSCREAVTVGEAPPEPSGVLARLFKSSSYDLTLTRVSPGQDAHLTPMARRRLSAGFPRPRDTVRTLSPAE